MRKDELIKKLQSIPGNPKVLLNDIELGVVELNGMELDKLHQLKDGTGRYITDFEFNSENGVNTYFHDNYREDTEECIIIK